MVWLRVGISKGLRFGGNKCISWPLSRGVQCGQWHKGHTKHGGPTNAPRPLSHKHEEVVTKRKRGHRISCIVVGEPRPIRIGGFGMGPISQLCGFVICTKLYILWNHSPPSTSCDASHTQYMMSNLSLVELVYFCKSLMLNYINAHRAFQLWVTP